MKKTLERLKKDARDNVEVSTEAFKKFLKGREEMSKEVQTLIDLLFRVSFDAQISLLRYIQALEDYGYELDEAWEGLLKSAEATRKGKPIQKEKGTKKKSYID